MQLIQARTEETLGFVKSFNTTLNKQSGDNFIDTQRFRKFFNNLYIIVFSY